MGVFVHFSSEADMSEIADNADGRILDDVWLIVSGKPYRSMHDSESLPEVPLQERLGADYHG
jgi:hypothetical protein